MAILKRKCPVVSGQWSKGIIFWVVVFLLSTYHSPLSTSLAYAVRIKEIASFEGVRANHLIGYGLVVGLAGTGDKGGTEFTIQSLTNMLNRLGIKVSPDDVSVKNVAAVVVTAELPPFKRPGARIDVLVSSIGDAKSLQGGTLLFTPLRGADGVIYAVAQGPVSIGGFIGGGEEATVQKNHLTVGRIPGGGVVEKEVPLELGESTFLVLREMDFTTANKIAQRINAVFGGDVAFPMDGTRISLKVPDTYRERPVEFLAKVEGIDVPVDTTSRVIVNERTGTVIMGENVRISTVAVAHGNLTVEIKRKPVVVQPPPFSPGETVITGEEEVVVEEEKARLMVLEEGVVLGDLVRALNLLGVTPRDLISILQAIKAAGALQAELELI